MLPFGLTSNADFFYRGVTNIRLVDFDRVTMSSLNRHATATLSDVGRSKVESMKSALMKMSLKVEVDAREELWRKEDGGALLEEADWVIGMSVVLFLGPMEV